MTSRIAAVGDAHAQRAHVLAEAAGDVVVLAVHVGRHHAAERDVAACPATTGVNQPRGRKSAVEAQQREPGLGAQDARVGVEGEDAVGEPRSRRRGAPRGAGSDASP